MIYQVNLTYGLAQKRPIYDVYYLQNSNGEKWITDLELIEINMSKIDKLCYHDNERGKYKYLAMLNVGEEELDNYCKGDKLMEKYKDKIREVNKDPKLQELMSYDEEQRLIQNSIREEG